MNTPPLVSIVICTYNRRWHAERALQSVLQPEAVNFTFEVILVNDGSTDDTAAMAAQLVASHPLLRVINQTNAGLALARNAGWQAARGSCIAFLDDDATAIPGWAGEFASAFQRLPETVAVLGGPIDLEWEIPRPAWIPDEGLAWLGFVDFGPDERVSDELTLFSGGNMAWRRTWLERCGGFNATLGRVKGNLLSHEESHLWTVARALGARSGYVPAARIHHFAPRTRLNLRWFRRRLWWEGVSVARTCNRRSQSRAIRIAKALNYFRASTLTGRNLLRTLQPWTWRADIHWQFNLSYQAGYAWELAREGNGSMHARLIERPSNTNDARRHKQ